ncbi:hypothetical protein Aspvir_007551 [Aspergillus viridinutans]|uniref:Amidohydrolase-related domain-containing protein n=1 Tax=Aspergillus viridinutans TaxID=75553 RepID=A0A9P3F3C6_ASPVI|nr:uncharacterized protein Aspvir_007551 [Aspergillus viridinutans]GIK03479.1 hypothetical protein Aspvir_007551 [Aspergillus viridinutans]
MASLNQIERKVVFDRAFGTLSGGEVEASLYVAPWDRERYVRQIHITGERLQLSDEHGIGCTMVSLTVPGIQGIADKTEAGKTATLANNWITEQIKEHRDRLGAFACLSMHDPVQAGQEHRRCVKDLDFTALCCVITNMSYDTFWKVLMGPDIPLYTYPAAPADVILEKLYSQRPLLIGSTLSFANGVSLDALGLIGNGVLDRLPTVKVIIGHLGELIPFDYWRLSHSFEDVEKPIAEEKGKVLCKNTVYDYFKQNIWTTSGHFSTATLKYVVDEIGTDRVLFSINTHMRPSKMAVAGGIMV